MQLKKKKTYISTNTTPEIKNKIKFELMKSTNQCTL